jgi:large subunit ribosomal protein L4
MSTKIKVYNQKAEETGEVKLSDKIFKVEINEALVHQAMVAQMSNERQVLAHTKSRSEVRGGGKKPWRQKGTGRARAGSSRSPIWIGGGVTFGPKKTRNFSKNINKKMKQKAMFMVLSDRLISNKLAIIDKLDIKEYKTKEIDKTIKNFEEKIIKEDIKKDKRSILLINDKKDDKIKYSSRNLLGLKTINTENINILDLLKYRNLVITKKTIEKLEKIYK